MVPDVGNRMAAKLLHVIEAALDRLQHVGLLLNRIPEKAGNESWWGGKNPINDSLEAIPLPSSRRIVHVVYDPPKHR